MAFSVVQSKVVHNASGNPQTITLNSNTTTGNNLVIVSVVTGLLSVSGITVSAGSASFSKAVATTGNGNTVEIWYAPNITGGTTPTVTVTYSGSVTGDLWVYEVAGGTIALDGVNGGSSSSSSAMSAGSVTTTTASDILFSAFQVQNTAVNDGSGWTSLVSSISNLAQYKITTSSGSYAGTANSSPAGFWVGSVAAFKVAPLSFIQRADGNSAGLSGSAVYPSSVTAGNLLVAVVSGNSLSMTVSSITDTRGNTWTNRAVSSGNDGTSQIVYLYDCVSVGSGANTVSVTVTPANGGGIEIYVWEFHTTSGTWTFDTGSVSQATSISITSGAKTISQSAEALVGYAATFGSPTGATYGSGWIGTNSTTNNFGAYQLTSATGSYAFTVTQGSSGRYVATLGAYYAASGAPTNVNATDSISAHAAATFTAQKLIDSNFAPHGVATATFTPFLTHNASAALAGHATCAFPVNLVHNVTAALAGHAADSFTSSIGGAPIYGTLILQGKATLSSFRGLTLKQQTVALTPYATGTFSAILARNASVAIHGAAGAIFNPGSSGVPINATVRLFGFAANNIAITQFIGRASLTLRAGLQTPLLTFKGKAALTLNSQVVRSVTVAIKGKAALSLFAPLALPTPVNGTLILQGQAGFTNLTAFLTHDAQVVIEAGNLTFIPVEAKAAIMGRAQLTLSPKTTHSASLNIQGRAALTPIPQLVNLGAPPSNIFSAARISGRATGTFLIPPLGVPGTVNLAGNAFLTPAVTRTVSLNATVNISGRATNRFMAFVQGSLFSNGVLMISGRARMLNLNSFNTIEAVVLVSGTATLHLVPGGAIRAGLQIQGKAKLTVAVAKQPLQWSSGHTLQYKVWQYNTEQMVRVLGSSWTVQSVGLSFQAVGLEVVQTEAGWGS